MTTPEFSCLLPASDKAGIEIEADAEARARIATRLDLINLDSLGVHADISAIAGGAEVRGKVRAALVQRCAATDLPVPAEVEAAFNLRYLRDISIADDSDEEEVELSSDDCDILPLDSDRIDLGEAAVQSLSLALDPYPRHPDADRLLAEKGILSEAQAGPFAGLAALRKDRAG